MTSSASRIGLGLGSAILVAGLLAGCEPEPVVTTHEVSTDQLVRLQGQRVPADNVYWLFTDDPIETVPVFSSLDWEIAEFVPRYPGEYVIDRWAVSGPLGVWTDRFIVTAVGTARREPMDEPTDLALPWRVTHERPAGTEAAQCLFGTQCRSVESRDQALSVGD